MANMMRKAFTPSSNYAYGVDPFRLIRDVLNLSSHGEGGFATATAERGADWAPHFEVLERKDAYVFRADLPGVKEDDLEISLTENRLLISGKRAAEQRGEGETFYAYERSFGSFTRGFTLPEGVDGDSIQAALKDGVLNLVVPKKPEVQPRKISIKPTTAAGNKQ